MSNISGVKFALPTGEDNIDFAIILPIEDGGPKQDTLTMIRPNRLVRVMARFLASQDIYFRSSGGDALLLHSLPCVGGEEDSVETQLEFMENAAIERCVFLIGQKRDDIDKAWCAFKGKLKTAIENIKSDVQESPFLPQDNKFSRTGITVLTALVRELCEHTVDDHKKGRQELLRELSDYIVYSPNRGDKFKARVNNMLNTPVEDNREARIFQMLYGRSVLPADAHKDEAPKPIPQREEYFPE